MIQKAQRLANMTFGITQKSCNKLMIGKCYWKCVALPSFLHGASILSLTETEIKKLQVCENGVFRQILGAPRYSPVCTLRGEVGASLMKTRIMEGNLQFLRGTVQGKNDLTRKVALEDLKMQKSPWAKTIRGYLESTGLTIRDLERMTKPSLKKCLKEWDNRQWLEELETKTSIGIYRAGKPAIKEDPIYDNTPASIVLFQARSNTLPLEARKRDDKECKLCGKDEENQHHFLLECEKLTEERLRLPRLQRPHPENTNSVLRDFLFNDDNGEMEYNKEGLYRLWRLRKRMMVTMSEGGWWTWTTWRWLFNLSVIFLSPPSFPTRHEFEGLPLQRSQPDRFISISISISIRRMKKCATKKCGINICHGIGLKGPTVKWWALMLNCWGCTWTFERILSMQHP